MRWFLYLGISAILPHFACLAAMRKVTDAQVREVHRSALLIDTHNDVTGRTVNGFEIGERASDGHTDLPRLREGGFGAVFFVASGTASAHRALQMIDPVRYEIIGRHPDDFLLARTATDVELARDQGKVAALIGLEGGHAIEDSLRLLRAFLLLGVRYMTLTHDFHTNWADSGGYVGHPAAPRHNGLTEFGKDVVREMNRLGMIVDISHVSDKTFWDTLAVSRAPLFASHSSCRALSNISRNMSDEMIRAMAKKGGVIQINVGCDFLSQKCADAIESLDFYTGEIRITEQCRDNPKVRRAELEKYYAQQKSRIPQATLEDVVAHIDHVVKIAGVDAVGIGSDFDGIEYVPAGLEDVSKFPNLTRVLLEGGYSPSEIRKIYG